MKFRRNSSQRTDPIHSIELKTHVLGGFGPFHYFSKGNAKLAELAPLTPKFDKRTCVGIFRNDRTRSTPLDPKLIFCGVSDRFVAARKSKQNWPNWRHKCISSLNEVALEFFTMSAPNPLHLTQLKIWDV
jgi:hypothetical protein